MKDERKMITSAAGYHHNPAAIMLGRNSNAEIIPPGLPIIDKATKLASIHAIAMSLLSRDEDLDLVAGRTGRGLLAIGAGAEVVFSSVSSSSYSPLNESAILFLASSRALCMLGHP
jgi:hypothetical protein